jgi:glycerophosphoryl diester phosphodiesterase
MVSRPLVLAHRGASARAPANTLEAFALARTLGADGVELDVRRTADDMLVVHHDPDVAGIGLLADTEFATVRAAQPAIPTLAEALAQCEGLLVNVEIKCLPWEPDSDLPDRRVLRAAIEQLRASTANVIISSFELDAVDACRTLAPELTTAWLTTGQELATTIPFAVERGHEWLHPDRDAALAATAETLARAHADGLRIDVWTVDDPGEVEQLVALGVDGVITNVPDVVLALF